ncbi:MAG: hypothetical protein PHE06_03165, partial [Lachnospiraceae bacterium]|nr:hypothetical protein [Lachnospiraceae bacterium]
MALIVTFVMITGNAAGALAEIQVSEKTAALAAAQAINETAPTIEVPDSGNPVPTTDITVTDGAVPMTQAPSPGNAVPETQAPSPGNAVPETEAPSSGNAVPETQAPSPGNVVPETKAPSPGNPVPETQAPSSGNAVPETQAPVQSKPDPVTEVPGLSKPDPTTETPGEGEQAPPSETQGPGETVGSSDTNAAGEDPVQPETGWNGENIGQTGMTGQSNTSDIQNETTMWPQNGVQTETESEERTLKVINERIEVHITKKDGSAFAAGTHLEMKTVSDMVKEDTDPIAAAAACEKSFREAWKKLLTDRYVNLCDEAKAQEIAENVLKGISFFQTCHISVKNADGSEVGQEETDITFFVKDKDFYEKALDSTQMVCIGTYDDQFVVMEKEGTVTLKEEDKTTAVKISVDKNGWFSFFLTDISWKEPWKQVEAGAEEMTEPSSETGTEVPSEPGSEAGTEMPSEPGSEAGTEVPSEPGSEAGTEVPSEPSSEAGAEVPSEPGSEAGTEVPSEPGSEAGTEVPSEPGSEAGAEVPSEPGSEAGTEAVIEIITEPTNEIIQEEHKEITVQKDDLIIKAVMADGTSYEEGAYMAVMTLAEILEGADEAELAYYDNLLVDSLVEKYSTAYRDSHNEMEWTEEACSELALEIRDAITVQPYNVEFYQQDGSSLEAGEQTLSFVMQDKQMIEDELEKNKKIEIATYDGGMNAFYPEMQTVVPEDESSLSLVTTTGHVGLFAVVQYDNAFLYSGEDMDELTGMTETELEADLYWEGDVSTYKPDGITMTASSKFNTSAAYGANTYSGKYGFLGWIDGVSSIKTFKDPAYCTSSNLKTVSMQPSNEGRGLLCNNSAYYPKSNAPAGHFGWIVSKAGYNVENNCYVDVLVTVSNWRTWAYDEKGNKIAVNPCFGMNNMENKLEWVYYGPDPAVEFDIKVIKSGTANGKGQGYTMMPGDYRFCWEDVDHGQRYGVFLDDGAKMDARYALNNSVLYTSSVGIFGKTYELFQSPSSSGTDTSQAPGSYYRWACWTEVSNLSHFHMLIEQSYTCNGMAGYWSSRYTASMLKNRSDTISADIDKGDTLVDGFGMMWMNWSGAAPGPTKPAIINKRTSNDGNTWNISNELGKVEDEWWYSVVLNVPYISDPDYYYDSLKITDVLPAGVDYRGSFSAVNLDTNKDATGLFALTGQAGNSNNLTVSAAGAAMN